MSASVEEPDAPWTVRPAHRLVGEVLLPGDKSISHRALILSALSPGVQTLEGLSGGADVLATAAALRAMGADISWPVDGAVRVGPARDGSGRAGSGRVGSARPPARKVQTSPTADKKLDRMSPSLVWRRKSST